MSNFSFRNINYAKEIRNLNEKGIKSIKKILKLRERDNRKAAKLINQNQVTTGR